MYDILNRIRLIISNVGLNTFVDVGIVYYVLYRGYLLIRDMRAKQLVKGIVLLVALIPISSIFDLYMVEFILSNTFQVGLIALVIVFQPEIRKALEYLGRTSFSLSNLEKTNETSREIIKEITSTNSYPSSGRPVTEGFKATYLVGYMGTVTLTFPIGADKNISLSVSSYILTGTVLTTSSTAPFMLIVATALLAEFTTLLGPVIFTDEGLNTVCPL
jgi:hypothetical protein